MDAQLPQSTSGEMRSLEFEEPGSSTGSAGYFEIDAAEFDGSF